MERKTIRMSRDLQEMIPKPKWPSEITLRPFSTALTRTAHALLELGCADGGGSIAPYREWWSALSGDGEYDPELCLVTETDGNQLVGFAQCWTSGFIKDLVVHPEWRKKGIGRGLILHSFQIFKSRGAKAVDLKVHSDNHSAIRLYHSVGMSAVPD
jgi:ribosomal protein S18 acetylase RimI-like enzyme